MKSKFIIWGVIFFTIYSCVSPNSQTRSPEGQLETESGTWSLFWSDEFNGNGKPDPAKWTHEIGIKPTNGSQFYTDALENCYQEDGSLFIKALDIPMGDDPYTSARITTQNKFQFTYGRVEFRAKVPQDIGSWPALWLLGANYATEGWPGCGEIDVMESIGSEGPKIHGSAHALNFYWKNGSQQTGTIVIPDAAEEFHVYAIEWFPSHIDFFVDDTKYLTVRPKGGDITDIAAWPFNSDQFIIMNICVDGDWEIAPNKDSFPMIMEIDYVRVYKQLDDNGGPSAYAGEDISAGDMDKDGIEKITLDATKSLDPTDGTTYSWFKSNEEIASGKIVELSLPVGEHNISLVLEDTLGNISTDEVKVTINNRGPFKVLTIPGTIEAEDYDIGGQNWTFYDTTPGNSGNAYRNDAVDIGAHEDGFNLGWIAAGEFVEYSISKIESGTYDILLYLASDNQGSDKNFEILLNGSLLTRAESPYTSGWTNWQEVIVKDISINKNDDSNILRINLLGSDFNIDKLIFKKK